MIDEVLPIFELLDLPSPTDPAAPSIPTGKLLRFVKQGGTGLLSGSSDTSSTERIEPPGELVLDDGSSVVEETKSPDPPSTM